MSHMIKENDRIQTLKSESQAWHKLDERVDTIVYEGSPLDYTIAERYPVIYLNGKTTSIKPNKDDEENEKADVLKKYLIGQRTGGPEWIISCVNDTFETFAGSELWEVMEKTMANVSHHVSTIGTLRNGKRQFITCRITDDKSDKFEKYISFLNGLDGGQALSIYSTSVRIVCQNTVNMSLDSATDLQVRRHTSGLRIDIPAMVDLMRSQLVALEKYQSDIAKWETQTIDDRQAQSLIVGLVAGKSQSTKDGLSTRSFNRARHIYHLFRIGKGNSGKSLADVFNGFTEFHTHHSRQFRKADLLKQKVSSEFGTDAQTKSDLYHTFLDDSKLDAIANQGEAIIKANQLSLV